jgi:cold shock CspA family protein
MLTTTIKFWQLLEGDRFKLLGAEQEDWFQVEDGSRSTARRNKEGRGYVSTNDDGDVYAHDEDPVIVQMPRPGMDHF